MVIRLQHIITILKAQILVKRGLFQAAVNLTRYFAFIAPNRKDLQLVEGLSYPLGTKRSICTQTGAMVYLLRRKSEHFYLHLSILDSEKC